MANEGDNVITELSAATGAVVKIISGSNYGLDAPDTIVSYGAHIWVVNAGGSVTELSAFSGALTRVIRGAAYGFDDPSGIAEAGEQIWVPEINGQSVTEFPVS